MKIRKKSFVAMLLATSIMVQPVAAVKAEGTKETEAIEAISNGDGTSESEIYAAVDEFVNGLGNDGVNKTMGLVSFLMEQTEKLVRSYNELKKNPIVEDTLAGRATKDQLEDFGKKLDGSIQTSEEMIKASRELLAALNNFVDGLTEESYNRLGFVRDSVLNVIKTNIKSITDNVIHVLDETLEGLYAIKLKYDVAMAVYTPELQTYENIYKLKEGRDSLSRDPRIVFGNLASKTLDNLDTNLRKTGKYLNEGIEFHFTEYENVIGFRIPDKATVKEAERVYNNLSDAEKAKVDEELYERVLIALKKFEEDIDQSLDEQRQIVNFLSELRNLAANGNKGLNTLTLEESQKLVDVYRGFNARQRKIVRVTGVEDSIYGKGNLKGMADTIDALLEKHTELSIEDYRNQIKEVKASNDLDKQFILIKEFALKEVKLDKDVRDKVEGDVRDLAYSFNEKIDKAIKDYDKYYEAALKNDDLTIEDLEKMVADVEKLPKVVKEGYHNKKTIKVKDIEVDFESLNYKNIKAIEDKIVDLKSEVAAFDKKTKELLENDKATEFELKYQIKQYNELKKSIKASVNAEDIEKLRDKLSDLLSQPEKPSKNVVKYSVGAKVRDKKGNYLGYLEKGKRVEGYVEDKLFIFVFEGNEATVHTAFLRDTKPESVYYLRKGSNIRSNANIDAQIITHLDKGTKVMGVKEGAWTKITINGRTGYVASKRLTTENLVKKYVSKGVKVRDNAGREIGYIKPGLTINGVLDGNYVRIEYKGIPARVHVKFVK